jgi:WD40 repeat protein
LECDRIVRPGSAQGTQKLGPPGGFFPNGKTLASVDFDLGVTKLWDVPTQRFITNLLGTLGEHAGGGAAFSPNGRLLATSTYHGTVTFWDIATLQQIRVLTNDFPASSLAFSPNSKVLGVASGFLDRRPNRPLRSLAFCDVASGQKLNRLTNAEPDAVAVSFSRNGRLVAIGYFGGWVRLWDWETGAMTKEFREHLGEVPTVAFSANGNFLASGGNEDHVVLYGVEPPCILAVLEGHTGAVNSVAFAPDDKTLAAAGNDGTIRLWSLATYQPVLTLRKHAGIVVGIAFTRGGDLLASCGGDGDVRLWPAPPFNEFRPAGLHETQHDDNKKESK